MWQHHKILHPLLERAAECPEEVAYLFDYFTQATARRTSGPHGPNPVSHVEVEAWARRMGLELSSFEQEALDTLEGLFLVTYYQAKEAEAP